MFINDSILLIMYNLKPLAYYRDRFTLEPYVVCTCNARTENKTVVLIVIWFHRFLLFLSVLFKYIAFLCHSSISRCCLCFRHFFVGFYSSIRIQENSGTVTSPQYLIPFLPNLSLSLPFLKNLILYVIKAWTPYKAPIPEVLSGNPGALYGVGDFSKFFFVHIHENFGTVNSPQYLTPFLSNLSMSLLLSVWRGFENPGTHP